MNFEREICLEEKLFLPKRLSIREDEQQTFLVKIFTD